MVDIGRASACLAGRTPIRRRWPFRACSPMGRTNGGAAMTLLAGPDSARGPCTRSWSGSPSAATSMRGGGPIRRRAGPGGTMTA